MAPEGSRQHRCAFNAQIDEKAFLIWRLLTEC